MQVRESYTRAVQAKSLKVSTVHRTEADILISAGWASQADKVGLGSILMRLDAECGQISAREMLDASESLADRVLLLAKLQTLDAAKSMLALHAAKAVVRLKTNMTADERLSITGRALQDWLFPVCHHCNGAGLAYHEGAKKFTKCRNCHGTGNVPEPKNSTQDQLKLYRDLMDTMTRYRTSHEARMATRLRDT